MILQFGLGIDLLGNGVRYALLEPAFQPRGLAKTARELMKDLSAHKECAFGLVPLAMLSALGVLRQCIARKLDTLDVLVLATWLKSFVAYLNPGADYNHLFDLSLFSALHANARFASWLTPGRVLWALALLFALDRPYELLLQAPRPSLSEAPALRVARALSSLPKVPTLCEDALVALEAKLVPLVPDAGLVSAVWHRAPELRRRWFGPRDAPGSLQRIVLMHDPFDAKQPELARHWYSVVNYDQEFFTELESRWKVVMVSPDATVLERVTAR